MSLDDLYTCSGLGCNFLHSDFFGVLFWICAGNSFDNTGDFFVLLSRFYIKSRPFLPLTHPTSKGQGEHKEIGGGTASTADPANPGIFQNLWPHAQHMM